MKLTIPKSGDIWSGPTELKRTIINYDSSLIKMLDDENLPFNLPINILFSLFESYNYFLLKRGA